MEDFTHLFASHFTDPYRSLENTLAGIVDHAVRFRATLPTDGPLAPVLLAACKAAEALSLQAQAVQQTLGLNVGTQKQAGSQTETALKTAFDRIRKNEGSLKGDLFIEDLDERQRLYALLYPEGGLSYYTRARLGTEVADRLGEYLTRTETESKALGEVFVQRVQDDLGPFRKTRNTQLAAQTKTDDSRTDRHDLVVAIDNGCDYDYHLLSAYFRDHLDRVANYWNPAFYLRTAARAATGEVPNLAVQPHQHRQLYDLSKYAQLTTLTVSLRDGGPLQLARVPKATSPLPADTLTLAPGQPLTLPLADVPGTGDHLVVYNETGKALHVAAQLS